jgi:hypothetical protein
MPQEDFIQNLKDEHAGLEQAIESEMARPMPDGNLLADLKRQKLRIKDELHRLEMN